ncbi:MAG: aminopeptidase, partial [Spirochaetes bacterium]|nr:aminopeptidase [Spirochaetota bacterium]
MITMKTSSVAVLQSRFALLLAKIALNVQKGQSVVLWKAPVESQEFIRKIVEACYMMGAVNVDVFWTDPYLDRARFSTSPIESCCAPQTERSIEALERASGNKAAILLFDCTCAGIFAELNIEILSRENSCEARLFGPMWEELSRGHTTWTVTVAPNTYWAMTIYPHDTPRNALKKLWADIAST